jgi:hypothetical protein
MKSTKHKLKAKKAHAVTIKSKDHIFLILYSSHVAACLVYAKWENAAVAFYSSLT